MYPLPSPPKMLQYVLVEGRGYKYNLNYQNSAKISSDLFISLALSHDSGNRALG